MAVLVRHPVPLDGDYSDVEIDGVYVLVPWDPSRAPTAAVLRHHATKR
ncbi:hypothetical protein EDD27_4589 [Nonomuraea polychroma]|uniref:Uncharacterized protein n=1 Tax=Nonomuraea polychroma TaxID=46176 RepID=A0A438M8C5_9ACTN|nr:hypothetical protein EDD27_4589 [Nonomuraea polychroma]